MRTVLMATALAATLLAAASCSDPTKPEDVKPFTVQITQIQIATTTLQCKNRVGNSAIYVALTLVNTTTDSVYVTGISSNGVVLRAQAAQQTATAIIGSPAYVNASMDFSPADGVLRPHDGEVKYTAIMPNACYAGGNVGHVGDDYLDVQVTYTVHTTAGDFQATPQTFHQLYSGGG